MKLEQLRQLVLETEGLSPETEVRMAHQPRYPLQATIAGWEVLGCDDDRISELEAELADVREEDLSSAEEVEAHGALQGELEQLRRDGNQTSIVYLAEGGQVYEDPYLSGVILERLGWR